MIKQWILFNMNLTKQISLTTVILGITVVLFSLTDLDFPIQDLFYNFTTQTWILDNDLQPYNFIFYTGIKKLLIVFALSFLIALVFFRKKALIKEYQKGIIIVIFSAILVPVIVGELKKSTNMPCPENEIHYGGVYPKTAVWESYPKDVELKKIQCWPAGHASGGFALLSLFFLFKTKRNQFVSLAVALSIGWSMGLYKMLVGDHFLSHTIITMELAWLIILGVVKLVNLKYNQKIDD